MNVLKEALKADGHCSWEDSAVAGGSGTNALQVLQARVASGNPPAAMQMHGEQIRSYAEEGLLGDLSEIATEQNWDAVMAPELQAFAKYNGVYVGVPFNEHRHNWMWVSKKIIDQYGGDIPTTWDEWFVLADKMKADGVQPLAHGGQPWQEFMLWEDILVATGGAEFHKKAITELDPAALESDTMVKTFDTFRKVLSYADANARQPRLEPRHLDGDREPGGVPVHGRLGKGRIHGGRQEGECRLRLRSCARNRRHLRVPR